MQNRQFVEKWVLNPRTGSVNREIDVERGSYPPTLASGYYHWGASQVYTALLSVPYVSGASIVSARIFKLKRLIVHNDQVPNKLVFYDGPGTSVTAFMMNVKASETGFIDNLDLPFQSHVCASNLDSEIFVRVQGVLITSE